MSAISIVEYMHELKNAGFTDQQSEVQARSLELIINNVKSELKQELHADELVRKMDLDLAVEKLSKKLEMSESKSSKNLDVAIEKLSKNIELLESKSSKNIELLESELSKKLELSELKLSKNLDIAVEKIRYDTLRFIVWTGVASIMAMAGMLAKGFHWL